MSTTPQINGAWNTVGNESQLQTGFQLPPAAGARIGRGQLCTASPSTGFVGLADAAAPNQIGCGHGYPGAVTAAPGAAGSGTVLLWQGESRDAPGSTIAGDSFAATDIGVPYYAADENTPGKLSNYAGSNRSLHGIVLGLWRGMPALWSGVVAWLVARCVTMANNASAGAVAYPADSGATVDIGSTSAATAALIIPRTKLHGALTSVEIIPSAALSATSGNDRTITIWKLDTLGVASPVSVATFVTTTALVAGVAQAFTLTGTTANLNMLETDILAYSTVHASSGAVIPQSAIRANMKVQ